MSKQIDLGPVLPILKGNWVSGTAYERLNIVRHNSAAWVCNVNVIPDADVNDAPSSENANWVVLAEDTSAVASVNGQTGHVTINIIETPSDDSNDESIANTEWVRDRIDEAVGAVSDDTTVALAGISASLDNKLDKSGGTMTGDEAIIFDKAGDVTALTGKNDGTTRLTLSAGGPNGGFINILGGLYDSSLAGGVQVVGRDSNGELTVLAVSEHGVTVDNTKVFTELGGNIYGELKFNPASQNGINAVLINSNDSYVQFCGSSAWANGAVCTLHGKSYSTKPGWLELRASDGTNAASLVLKPDGSLLKSGSPVAVFASNRLVFPNNTQFWIA